MWNDRYVSGGLVFCSTSTKISNKKPRAIRKSFQNRCLLATETITKSSQKSISLGYFFIGLETKLSTTEKIW